MELRIVGTPNEIADLVVALQDRQNEKEFSVEVDLQIPDGSPDDLVVKDD